MQLLCGQCGTVQETDDDVTGAIECTHCGHSIVMPGEVDPGATAVDFEPPVVEEGFAEIARKAVPRKVHLTCKDCNKRFTVSARRAGRQGRCPACGTAIHVPFPDDEMEFDLPDIEHRGMPDDDAPIELEVIEDGVPIAPRRSDETLVLPRAPVHHRKPSPAEQADALAQAAAEASTPAPAPKQAPRAKASPSQRAPAPTAPRAPTRTVAPARARDDARPARPAKPPRNVFTLLAIGVGLAVAAGLAFHFIGRALDSPSIDDTTTPNGLVSNTNGTGPSTNGHNKPPNGTNGGQNTTKPVNGSVTKPVNGHVKPPPVSGIACEVKSAAMDMFAGEGYFPAAVGKVYLKAHATITAQDSPMVFTPAGDEVTVSIGATAIPSLGLAVTSPGLVPAQADLTPVRLEPGQSRDVTFLFLVPAGAAPTALTIAGMDPAPLPRLASPPAVQPGALAGRFAEAQPRNLKPLLADPVMAAIQDSRNHQIFVRGRGDTLTVYVTPGTIRGVAKPIGGGLYETVLKHGGDELTCTLRLADGGDTLIVYLADEPFHQMTYTRVTR